MRAPHDAVRDGDEGVIYNHGCGSVLAADGFGDMRFSDGLVFQHLVEGPVSKSVADLERRAYLGRPPR